ncbi:hypothetical protein [Herpetosiphon giganteus]|uniref:hypothetical protein n=1 Tax=Herpetosiphon giganteus TaxID=2029754 RepID=UPI0019595684|nr:hypothetical protein [Herpetosiphon giganteus]MBM7846662.1 hypothetical protein [Herpetosiphon giganteus]
MDVYRDLKVYGTQKQLDNFISHLKSNLSAGWDFVKTSQDTDSTMYEFLYQGNKTLPSVKLWMTDHEADTLYVNNVLPIVGNELLQVDYNRIVENFYQTNVSPIATELGLQSILTPDQKTLDDWLSMDTAAKLRQFSNLANKSGLHPLDQKRWFAFLVAVHQEHTEFNATILHHWLAENGWPEEQMWKLVLEYEFAQELLDFIKY